MREIKFRAWDKTHKEMLYDVLEIEQGGFIITSTLPEPQMNMATGMQSVMKARDFIWQQYTGLKDKNGVEIYEGDIVKGEYRTYQIEYFGAAFRLKTTDNSTPDLLPVLENSERVEVIGNIHENQELLK